MLLEKLEIHNTLNPKLWDNDNNLLPTIKNRLFDIRDEFLQNVQIPLNIIDIELVGSNVSYNYNPNSDLDMHFIVNFDDYDADNTIIQALYDLEKTKFNTNYDIQIKGIDVEIYVQDVNTTTNSNGIYSLYENKWIKFPKPITNIQNYDLSNEINEYKSRIDNISSSADIQKIIDDLYIMRKHSLDVEGEYGKGNQIFKEIRNLGLLDKLKNDLHKYKSKELTLEKLELEELRTWF